MIAWTSFSTTNFDNGLLQFEAAGESGIVFDQHVANIGFASAMSQTKKCDVGTRASFNPSTSVFDVEVPLCEDGYCDNPCPGVLAPQAMGYNPFTSQETSMRIKIDMDAVSTALAVNMGLRELNTLIMVANDTERRSLLRDMVNQGNLDQTIADHTTSYFGAFFFFFLLSG
jgi:hypothetical protein